MDSVESLLGDDDFLETSCLGREKCIEALLEDAPEGCLYCALETLDEEDDD